MYELREYRPGRWAKVEPESGRVVGLASDAEADAWIRAHLLGGGQDQDNGGNGERAAEVLPLFAGVATDPAPSPSPPKPTGNGATYYLAWQDTGEAMRPVWDSKRRLVLFDGLEAARQAAGPLGVGATVGWGRVVEVCKLFGLRQPGNGDLTDKANEKGASQNKEGR